MDFVINTSPEFLSNSGGGGFDDQEIWATEDEYRNWNPPTESNTTHSIYNYNNSNVVAISVQPGRPSPPNKNPKTSPSSDLSITTSSSRSKAIGRMFFKTKLCCKFRAGVCPYVTNCNFAHGAEELRRPLPNWQEIVAAHGGEERGVLFEQQLREEHQIPTISTSDSRGESQRSYKGRHCKKFYTEEGCPFGENCTFLHDEQSRVRESVAISVSPTVGSGYGGVVGGNQKPSNWKTRICNKWETTGNCPFGSKCHFAHGLAELHKHIGGAAPMDPEGRESSAPPESKPSGMTVTVRTNDTAATSSVLLSTPRSDFHNVGVPFQRPSGIRPIQKWKGPDKIIKLLFFQLVFRSAPSNVDEKNTDSIRHSLCGMDLFSCILSDSLVTL
ncbi:Zinc finger CCCH domain-containing protein, partial [Drosera capensis]